MSLRSPSLLLLAACTGTVPVVDDTGFYEEVAQCAGSTPGPVPGYDAYRYTEVDLPDGEVAAANWAWRENRVVPVNVDVASFVGTGLSSDEVLDSAARAARYWSEAGAGISFASRACGGSIPCDAPGSVTISMADGPDRWGLPAHTLGDHGDDPATFEREAGCLVGSRVTFFPSGHTRNGDALSYRWVPTNRDVEDLDTFDGVVDKPLHDTLVHELGHAAGLGDQDDPSVACSVMAHCDDLACGCSFEEIGPVDAAALRHVYAGG